MSQLWLGTHHFIVLHDALVVQEALANHRVFLGCTPFLDKATRVFFKAGRSVARKE